MRLDPATLAAILGMAAVTYALRLSGLLLADRLPRGGRWARALESLSGTVLMAIVAPAVTGLGWVGLLAAGATLLALHLSRNVLAAMAVGAAATAAARQIGLA
jgi:uncharacterized membrane protein